MGKGTDLTHLNGIEIDIKHVYKISVKHTGGDFTYNIVRYTGIWEIDEQKSTGEKFIRWEFIIIIPYEGWEAGEKFIVSSLIDPKLVTIEIL